jgi:hypothetical protein
LDRNEYMAEHWLRSHSCIEGSSTEEPRLPDVRARMKLRSDRGDESARHQDPRSMNEPSRSNWGIKQLRSASYPVYTLLRVATVWDPDLDSALAWASPGPQRLSCVYCFPTNSHCTHTYSPNSYILLTRMQYPRGLRVL